MKAGLIAGALFGLLTACDGGSRHQDPDETADSIADAQAEAAYEARQAAYEEHGADPDGLGADLSNVDPYDVVDNGDYACTQDCSGHSAGFSWAQENDVTDAADCGGNSQSFIEGCEAFEAERQGQADRDALEAGEMAADNASEESGVDDDWR